MSDLTEDAAVWVQHLLRHRVPSEGDSRHVIQSLGFSAAEAQEIADSLQDVSEITAVQVMRGGGDLLSVAAVAATNGLLFAFGLLASREKS